MVPSMSRNEYSARFLETRSERNAREAREAEQRKEDAIRMYAYMIHASGDHTWCDSELCRKNAT